MRLPSVLAAFAMILLATAGAAPAQELVPIGFCRDAGVQGGTATRTRGFSGCDLNAVRNAARNAAANAALNAAAVQCPQPVNAANAQARCAQAQSGFAPTVTLSGQLQASAGVTAAERAATHVSRVGNSGACVHARPVAERNATDASDRSCGVWIFTSPRHRIFVDAQATCGVICR